MAITFKSVLEAVNGLFQIKTVTATTSNQSVTPDNGYDGLSQVTVQPQQHSETYTPSANTASNDMGAVHNKRYVNTSGMIVPGGNKAITANGSNIDVRAYATASVNVTGTSITPSNASPASLTSGQLCTPSSNGYAIESYTTVTPSSASQAVANGNIYKMSANGVVVDGITSITPGQEPTAITAGVNYTPTANGKVVSSISTVNVGVNTVTELAKGANYHIYDDSSRAGYIIGQYSTVTPSNTPVALTGNTFYRFTASGKLVDDVTEISPTMSVQTLRQGRIYKVDSDAYVMKPFTTSINEVRTTMWINTSSLSSFASQNIIFTADSIRYHDYLIFTFLSSASGNVEWEVRVKTDDFMNNYRVSGGGSGASASADYYSPGNTNYAFARRFVYVDDTTISMGDCIRYTTTAASKQNGTLIPIKIEGMDEEIIFNYGITL